MIVDIKFSIIVIISVIAMMTYYVFFSSKAIEVETFVRKDTAILLNKNFVEEYSTLLMIPSGNVNVPVNFHHPSEYKLILMYKNEEKSFNVSEEKFNSYSIGESIPINIYKLERTEKDKKTKTSKEIFKY